VISLYRLQEQLLDTAVNPITDGDTKSQSRPPECTHHVCRNEKCCSINWRASHCRLLTTATKWPDLRKEISKQLFWTLSTVAYSTAESYEHLNSQCNWNSATVSVVTATVRHVTLDRGVVSQALQLCRLFCTAYWPSTHMY